MSENLRHVSTLTDKECKEMVDICHQQYFIGAEDQLKEIVRYNIEREDIGERKRIRVRWYFLNSLGEEIYNVIDIITFGLRWHDPLIDGRHMNFNLAYKLGKYLDSIKINVTEDKMF